MIQVPSVSMQLSTNPVCKAGREGEARGAEEEEKGTASDLRQVKKYNEQYQTTSESSGGVMWRFRLVGGKMKQRL